MHVETPAHHKPQTQPGGSLTAGGDYPDAWGLFTDEVRRLAALSRQRRQERETFALRQADTEKPDVASVGP